MTTQLPSLFVIILRYVVPISDIDAHRPTHLDFLDRYYEKGNFLASGRQVPLLGGVILARAKSRAELWEIVKQDPFYTYHLAEFQIFEFQPNKHANVLGDLMSSLTA